MKCFFLAMLTPYSGRLVSGKFVPAGCSVERCGALHETDKPNVILIYLGTNDCGYGAYRIMIQRTKCNYPNSKIVYCLKESEL